MTTAIAFFNNKGGVGKTTLACNFASHLAKEGFTVTVVDCDPQSNATQLLLDDTHWESLYEDKSSAEDRTVLRALRHIRAGDSAVETDIELQKADRFGVNVLAGHPSLSIIEDRLSASWSEFSGGFLGGARRSLWARQLVAAIDSDIVVFDLGPSLGALNRSVLLGSDYFVTPVAADLFSLYALENIGEWMQGWINHYNRYLSNLDALPQEQEQYNIPTNLPIAAGWAGYSVQQYVAKRSGGQLREVKAYDRYRRQIPERADNLTRMKAPTLLHQDLGVVPNMFSMVPMAQAAHAPIADLTTADGVRGAQVTQQKKYVEQLAEMFTRLRENLSL